MIPKIPIIFTYILILELIYLYIFSLHYNLKGSITLSNMLFNFAIASPKLVIDTLILLQQFILDIN